MRMKKIGYGHKITLILLVLGFFVCTNAQVTEYPNVDNSKATGTSVVAVKLTPSGTVVALRVSFNVYGSISPKTRIEYINPQTGLPESKWISRLVNANGGALSMGTKYKSLYANGFFAIFPKIPIGVRQINLIEEGGDWKWWYGIHITPRDGVDVKRLATTEEEINQLVANSKNTNAGMYEQLISTDSSSAMYRLAFVQTEEGAYLVYVGGTRTVGAWECGETKAILRPTVSKSMYKADWFMAEKTVRSAVVAFDGTTMKVYIDGSSDAICYVRMAGGTNSDDTHIYSEKWSGTGFALKGGYILTNYHVVEEANVINIYGISGDFENGIKASVIGSDKSNDLALLKISGNIPASFNSIPYSFKSKIADVGEDVYVVGYPLTATMGEEVKLTNGIISARTGFDGNVSQYQMSAPTQPGNSGGPLIDYNGNVIGVVCAKHGGAENVSYAVKVSQVRNLIESVSDLSIMNTTNILQGKALKDQVKLVNKYVYIIKCSK